MLNPEIITIEPIRVIAVRHTGAYTECGTAWERLMKFAYAQKFKNKKNIMGKNTRAFGVGYDDPNTVEATKLRYDACLTMDDDAKLEDGIREMTIEGGKYARFLHKGSYDGLAEKYNQIFGGWVIANNIKLRDLPPFEEYLNRDPRRTKPENLKTLIYLPIE
jgi:AraC family transcriptional regulator